MAAPSSLRARAREGGKQLSCLAGAEWAGSWGLLLSVDVFCAATVTDLCAVAHNPRKGSTDHLLKQPHFMRAPFGVRSYGVPL